MEVRPPGYAEALWAGVSASCVWLGLLWARELAGDMMERRRGIFLSRWTAGRYVKSWGLAVQKTMHRALKRNPARARGTGRKRGISLRRSGQGGKHVHPTG